MKMRTFVFYNLKCWNEIYSKWQSLNYALIMFFCNIFQANKIENTLQWIGKTSQVLPGDEIEEVSGSITHFFVWNINRTISFFCTFRYPKADTNLVIKGRINWFSVNFVDYFWGFILYQDAYMLKTKKTRRCKWIDRPPFVFLLNTFCKELSTNITVAMDDNGENIININIYQRYIFLFWMAQ